MGQCGRRSTIMAFTKLPTTNRSAPAGARPENAPAPDIWAAFRALRDARSAFGLKPGHIQTMQSLISFLRPGQGETVFASNLEICRRIGGIDERTLRRHIDRFVELGFIVRHDSPNRKRYRVRSSNGDCLSFGLSLAPLLSRWDELQAATEGLENARRDQLFLRKQLLAILAQIHTLAPDMTLLADAHKALRRKLIESEYRALIAAATAALREMSTAVDAPVPVNLSADDGQIVRHQSKSYKEEKDIDDNQFCEKPNLVLLTATCTEAKTFTSDPLQSWGDVTRHAERLAPMMGIQPGTFDAASRKVGREVAATAIFISLQLGAHIRNFAAYFHSITLGKRSSNFNPEQLLQRMSQGRMRTT